MKERILVCAYACLSESGARLPGGEAILGWNLVRQLARFHEVWALTSARNRCGIEAALRREPLPSLHFCYLDLPGWLRPLQRFQGGVQFCAYLWQVAAYFAAGSLHRRFHFHVFHHVTYANDWMASYIGALLPIPYIRGPGGGANRTPSGFLRQYSFRDRLWERFRCVGQWVLRHDPFFIMGQRRARAILVCNRESLHAIPLRWRHKAQLFPVNGVTASDLSASDPPETTANAFDVVTAGKLLHWKGFGLAIKAFARFAGGHPDARLTIIGDGPEYTRMRALVHELGVEPTVRFNKWLPREQVLSSMRSCDVFLYPSLRDGGGAVVVEAMAAGKPVICLDLGGPGLHVTEECGIKVPARSPEQAVRELAAALERLGRDKGLRLQMGEAARKRAERLYHWDRLGERLLEIYQSALGLDLQKTQVAAQ